MIIRKASHSDLTEIVRMAKAMADYHRATDQYYKPSSSYKTLEDDLAEDLDDKDSLILIAEKNGKAMGYFRGTVEPAPSYTTPKKIRVVYDLFIDEADRKRGAGDKLFAEALAWFKDRGVKNIELNVDARNNIGVTFWKKHGFFEYKIRMRLDL